MVAQVDDFIKFTNYRDLSEDEKEQISMLLEQAARQITVYLGTEDWGDGPNSASIAEDRQLYMVKRYFDNQEGLSSESYDGVSVSHDDGAYNGLRLTAYDKQVLSGNRKFKGTVGFVGRNKNNGWVW